VLLQERSIEAASILVKYDKGMKPRQDAFIKQIPNSLRQIDVIGGESAITIGNVAYSIKRPEKWCIAA
jgi:hypothetical protein